MRGFREFGAGGVVIELQPVEARLVDEKPRFGSAQLLKQLVGAPTALIQSGARGVEIALVDQR